MIRWERSGTTWFGYREDVCMRSFMGEPREKVGVLPAMGVKLEIEQFERGETGENSQNPGCLMYSMTARITEPEQYSGMTVRDWFTVGTKDDKRAKKAETWERSEGGAGALFRCLKRAGVATSEDDEEWMDAAEGAEVCAHLGKSTGRNGEPQNRIQLYFRESDKDFVGIGEALEADGGGRGRGGRKAKADGGDEERKARRSKARGDDDEEDDEKDEDDEDEKPKGVRGSAKKKARDADDEEDEEDAGEEADDDDEDEKPRKSARGAKAKKRSRDDD